MHTTQMESKSAELVLPLDAVDRGALPAVGGKGANLGELTRAGLPVPPGFCVTTAAYELVAGGAGLGPILHDLAATPPDHARLAKLAAATRAALLAAPVPPNVVEAITEAYRALGDGTSAPVAVRSSATAEDLPHASFAGQQDTFLNVLGANNVIEAVRRCWASLWTDRAVSYRASNGIDHLGVRLAVVVQRMVEAEVAGVLFTANPLTGRRRQTVIDAAPGLGDAVVSGTVNPDHFVVNTPTGEITERRLGDKPAAVRATAGSGTQRVELTGDENEASLNESQIRALANLGAQVEAYYGEPQDTEWAIDVEGRTWLLQARPITTLFPLPAGAPASDGLRVYFSVNVAQGVYRPLTPMGLQAFRLLGSAMATLFGHPPSDRYAGPSLINEAAGRLFFDITPALRSTIGRKLLDLATRNMEARTTPILRRLATDPRLTPVATPLWPVVRAVLSVLIRGRIPLRVAQALVYPKAAQTRAERVEVELRTAGEVPRNAGAEERLEMAEHLLLAGPPRILPNIAPTFAAGLGAYAVAGKLLGNLADEDERRVVLRGLPHNPTTKMDLALWALAQEELIDPGAARIIRETPPERIARDYRDGTLPPRLQTNLAGFLHAYGHRGVAEIDLGLSRWSEDPTYILGVLANYLHLDNPELAPDIQFRRATREAEEMVIELTRRAAHKGRLRGTLVGFLLRRARGLTGLREMPKFCIVLLFARVRALLWPVGEELVKSGRLESAEDIFFVTLPEARSALAVKDLRSVVRERRASYTREVRRRHVPRVLLSDGTEPAAGMSDASKTAHGILQGTPASGGVATARARVILDPTGAHLKPGEILVAPSTDPGWTPLFLTASGLVMEMGGAMSHGAVVAREYGIPAVVGVPNATEDIVTGQQITVDGAAGTIATYKSNL